MLKPSTITALLFVLLFGALALVPSSIQSHVVDVSTAPTVIEAVEDNATFYTIRADMRKCASPMCGGYFIKRVNQALTTCADGRSIAECYVASIDWNGANEVEPARALIRGTLETKGDRRGKYGVLKVAETWQSFNDKPAEGDFYRVRDLGLRCIAAPCETHYEAKLNTTISRNIAGVSLPTGAASKDEMVQVSRAMTSEEGILVAGSLSDVSGPAGKSKTLNASQFYLRSASATATATTTALKPCIRTGCSGEICADEEMMSTCEYRAEYACYKKAKCERQAEGNCGFTKTAELTSCLARTRRH
ncbi:MAG TPA: DUF6748 domain-containing protein [Pyrinomonadaceae bacterium]